MGSSESGSSSMYVYMLLWTFVPGFVTKIIQSIYYRIVYPVDSRSQPAPGDAKYNRHNRRIYTIVVLSYLAYTVLEACQQLPTNHYTQLNLTPSKFNSRALKLNFKKLSLQAHPDKNDGNEDQFIRIREAYETLNDPVRRYVYDRFGMEQNQCPRCRTVEEYRKNAVPNMLGYYIGTVTTIGLFALFGKAGFGSYWRWLALCGMFLTEASLTLWPESWLLWMFGNMLPRYTPHEQITILHQVYINFFIAVSQVGPIWIKSMSDELSLKDQLLRANAFTAILARQSADALRESFAPLQNIDEEDASTQTLLVKLHHRIKQMMINMRLMEDPEHAHIYSEAMGRVVRQRRRL
ncbi:hypothetical protein BDF19DRAFT_431874 [Syncephalis fuscata]|nr:hypothetical protein BDF19DRAFT_431874 [Syncephalis fuscata]